MQSTRIIKRKDNQPINKIEKRVRTGKVAFVGIIAPSITLYNVFQQGHLIFSISETLTPVKNALIAKGFHHVIANDLNTPTIKKLLCNTNPTLDAMQAHHYKFLAPLKDYLTRAGGHPIPNNSDPANISIAYRRACKKLLTSSHPYRRAHILIGDMDLNRSCNKEKSQHTTTDSEIRALYRHERQYGQNPNVFFYDKSLTLLSYRPWHHSAHVAEWVKYEQHLQNKARLQAQAASNTPSVIHKFRG